MDFKGKTAVITGGTEGIGKTIAYDLAKLNCNIVIISRKTEKHQAITKELIPFKIITKTYSCDVSSSEQVKIVFQKIKNEFHNIDFLINCAGISTSKPIENLTNEEFDQEIDINLKGTYYFINSAYSFMNIGGGIINMGSVRGRTGSVSTSPGYASAKAAVMNLTKSFAHQLAKYQIRVNCIAPGYIYGTKMNNNWEEEKQKKVKDQILLKRLGTPQDIANAVIFLLSDQSSYITGQTIDVNGGLYMN
jgi:3-oxoacyl-[acyl-carrier protein] reductase